MGPARGEGMKVREFLSLVSDLVRKRLPPSLKDFETIGPVFSLVKFHYGDSSTHYEVWVQRRLKKVEVGLHFEGDAERNSYFLERLSTRFQEIHSRLGPGLEPEQWTSSWTRIHESLPLQPLDERFLRQVAVRLAALIRVLEPLVREDAKAFVSKV